MDEWKTRLKYAETYLTKADPILAKLIGKHGSCLLLPHTDYYGELVAAIIGQQLSEKAGATIYRRFLSLFDNKLPTPARILAEETDNIRGIGVSYAKVSYMKDLAQHIIDGQLNLDHIANLPNETVVKQLVAIKGIGEWSAHMFMIFSLGRLDVLPVGDLGVRRAMMLRYGLTELPDKKTMETIAARHHWKPYQSVASWYLWRSLDNK